MIDRRRWTAIPSALLIVLLVATATCKDSPSDPLEEVPADTDLVFLGGPILTIEDGVAEAIAVRGNQILAVGSAVRVLPATRAARVIDLDGAALLPGFIDGHIHMIRNAGRQELSRAQAVEMALRHGITMLAEVAGRTPDVDNLLALEAAGELRLRVVAYPDYNQARPVPDGENPVVGTWYPANPPLVDPDRLLRIPGIKVFVDGAFSNDRGCYALTDPYPQEFQNDPTFNCPDPRGSLLVSAEDLADIIVQAESAGFQVAMHAIGDRALDTALDALQQARVRTGASSPRHQIHHGFLLRPDQMDRFLTLDVPFSVNGYFHTCDQATYPYYYGDRYVWYANRFALAEAGGRAFVETDFNFLTNPDEERFYNRPLDPLVNLWALVTHREIQRGPVCEPEAWLAQHPVSIERAPRMYTLGGAWAHGMDDLIGSLRPGKRADLIVLSGDPTAIPPDSLLGLQVLMTMVDGRVEYCAEDCPVR